MFCRRHGAISTSDPAGALTVRVREPDAFVRYRFGLGITDFLICGRCGVFVAAFMEIDGRGYGVANANVLEPRAAFARVAQPMDYDGEDVAGRIQRRLGRWTPATIREEGR
jgi:hypothetical protein